MKPSGSAVKKTALSVLMMSALLVLALTLVSAATVNNRSRTFFGYQMFVDATNSMKATDFSSGDLLLVRPENPSSLKPGDIITYELGAVSGNREIVTHKIRDVIFLDSGERGFVTYGTSSQRNDLLPVPAHDVIGKYIRRVPEIGHLFLFLKTIPGCLLCLCLPFAVLFASRIRQTRFASRQCQLEEQFELDLARAKLEEEQMQSREMMHQLLSMQSSLTQQNTPHMMQ